MGNEVYLNDGSGITLGFRAGVGAGQTTALYSNPAVLGTGGVHFEAPLFGKSTFYQDLNVIGGKDVFQGRYEAGVSFKGGKTDYRVGAYASNDFKSPEFAVEQDFTNPNTTKAPTHQGLFQAGLTAGVTHHLTNNIAIFAKGDIANLSYSKTGECVYPFSFKETKNGEVTSYVLDDKYRFEPGIKSALGASINAGATFKKGLGSLTVQGGYNNYQGANFMGTLGINIDALGK